jgi:hypothetical protein
MTTSNFSDLTWLARIGICWGFFWRGLVATLGSTLAGGIVGGGAGLLLSITFRLTGWCACDYLPIISVLGTGLGILFGLFAFYLYVGWILRAKMGKYRLALVGEGAPAT